MPARGAEVNDTDCFRKHFASLLPKYPELDAALREFTDFLRLGYNQPEIPVGPEVPGVYLQRMDYPALGSGGTGRFLVTYHATLPKPLSMSGPQRIYTLLTISER
jgi:hypothetical protein